MLCQNCGKNEVNFKYTQIINGVKKEMALCDKCAKELGLDTSFHMPEFNMPISVSSFLGDMIHEYENENFLPSFSKITSKKCKNCEMDYNDFIENGRLGCEECYNTFSNKIDSLLKNIHGSNRHVGRVSKFIEESSMNTPNEVKDKLKINENNTIQNTENDINNCKKNELEKLKTMLNKAIKEERYEDAAKIRDEIKKIDTENKN